VAAWPVTRVRAGLDCLADDLRHLVERVACAFCVGEAVVAKHLDPFVTAARGEVAACFAAQARDEARHARFFDRIAREVLRVPGASADRRLDEMRQRLSPELVRLFDDELPRVTRELGAGRASLTDAVGLYHMLLEGVVFTLGEFQLVSLLEEGSDLSGQVPYR
jgi:ribonucleoside-diphosphate reductase beta chain